MNRAFYESILYAYYDDYDDSTHVLFCIADEAPKGVSFSADDVKLPSMDGLKKFSKDLESLSDLDHLEGNAMDMLKGGVEDAIEAGLQDAILERIDEGLSEDYREFEREMNNIQNEFNNLNLNF